MVVKFLLLACSIIVTGNSIGYQHATFRSQSTQGKTWTGTTIINDEHFNITVHRDYLDVELEWELGVGGQAPQEYRDALEIVGNINLERGSKVLGMLLWYKNELLKAKLKRKEVAREQYEDVVDRNAEIPPPPRDPVIFEYGWGEDNYYISVFPVTWEGSRRLRLRYVIPRANEGKCNYFGYPHAFSNKATAILKKGDDISEFSLLDPSGNIIYSCKDSVILGHDEILTYSGKYRSIRPTLPSVKSYGTTSTHLNLSHYKIGAIQGEFACVNFINVGRLLESIKDSLPVGNDKRLDAPLGVFAIISNGMEKCSTGVRLNHISNVDLLTDSLSWTRNIYIFSRKPLIREVVWHVYLNDELWMESIEKPTCKELMDNSAAGCIAVATKNLMALDTKLPASLGAAFGFVDTVFSLLALEEDKLPVYLKNRYEGSGVPFLNEEDIFADTTDLAPVVLTQLFQKNDYNIPLKVKYEKNETDLHSSLLMKMNNGILTIFFGDMFQLQNGLIEITVFTLSGKVITRRLLPVSVANGNLQIHLKGTLPQAIIVNIQYGKHTITRIIQAVKF